MVELVPANLVPVRPAVEADLDLLVELFWTVAAEGRWVGAEIPFDRAVQRERLARAVADEMSTVMVAVPAAAGGPVGYIWVKIASYGAAEIAMLLVDGWRGQGLGRALLQAAISWASSAGAHKMILEVWPHNTAAIELYRRAGFVQEGRRLQHYRRRNGELWDSILMGRPLP
jgi:ribosomal protein S18 acetylase RimI-like enzyme